MAFSVLDIVRLHLSEGVGAGAVCVDATVGRGRDTLFLARRVGPSGHVYGFDVQDDAIGSTRERLAQAELSDRVTLFRAGHEEARLHLPGHAGFSVRGIVFNLGFLPGSDRSVVTRAVTTVAALDSLWPLVDTGGVLSVVTYAGHPGGRDEAEAVASWMTAVATGARVARYAPVGTNEPAPEAWLVTRTGSGHGRNESASLSNKRAESGPSASCV